jgi:uncharacterized protein YggE
MMIKGGHVAFSYAAAKSYATRQLYKTRFFAGQGGGFAAQLLDTRRKAGKWEDGFHFLYRGVFMSRVALAAVLALAPIAVSAQTLRDTTPNIIVTGAASQDVAPDRATLFLGVVTEKPTAADAAAENARAAQVVVAELKAQGVEAADIQTDGISLAPLPEPEPVGRNTPSKKPAKGFRARNDLAVTIKSVDKAGKIMSALIDKGANEIAGVSFSVSDADERLEKLRRLAMEDAEHKAKTYVEAIGLKLARVIEIRPESAENFERSKGMMRAAAPAAPTPSVPMEPGKQRLTERVTVIWAVTR